MEAHAGSPEAAYGTCCRKLVEAGYKVARVEQTETPTGLAERKKKAKGKKPQVVNREVCSITTAGTRTYCYMDDTSIFNKEGVDGNGQVGGGPVLIIKESMRDAPTASPMSDADDDETAAPPAVCEYGVCVVDAIRGNVTLGQFADDKLRSRLHTLLTTMGASEVILGKNASDDLKTMIRNVAPSARVEIVRDTEECPRSTAVTEANRRMIERKSPASPWEVNETVNEIARRRYFPAASKNKESSKETDDLGSLATRWPPVLKACVDGSANLALSALGAGLFYLQVSLTKLAIIQSRAMRPVSTKNNAMGQLLY